METEKMGISFEENIKELEEIVKKLESGEVSLDDMLKLFEEGVKRSRECTRQLEEAEQKISILTKKADGTMKEESFEI